MHVSSDRQYWSSSYWSPGVCSYQWNICIGCRATDASGVVDLNLTVPFDAPVGFHDLNAEFVGTTEPQV